jgi:putative membrane protein
MDAGTRLAVDRTRLAHERTLMAWVRTAVSMISFGFTIYKFFQFEVQGRPPTGRGVLGPREFALIMIAIGVLALLVSTVQHRWTLRTLRAEYGEVVSPLSLASLVAGLFGALGLIALVAVILRL